MLVKRIVIALLLMLSFHKVYGSGTSYDIVDLTAEEAYQKGKLLRAQFKNRESLPYLKHSLEQGNSDAAYLYSIVLLNSNRSPRTIEESRQYMIRAAQQGNRHAMRRLYQTGHWLTENERKHWQTQYYNSLIVLGKTKPGIAFYEMAQYFESAEPELSKYYLDKSMMLEYPPAYMEYATNLSNEVGQFTLPGERDTQIRKLYLNASELGYIPAIRKYIQILEEKRQFQLAFEWRKQALSYGDIMSLASIGLIYSGLINSNYKFVKSNKILAKAYLGLYLEHAGNHKFSSLYNEVEDCYFYTVNYMTDEQISESLLIEELLKNTKFYSYDLYW